MPVAKNHNKMVAANIAKWLKKGPAEVHAAGLEDTIYRVTETTYQDSGNASFNWELTEQGGNAYAYLKGQSPVGITGEGRTNAGMGYVTAVANFKRAQPTIHKVRSGKLSVTYISNPISSEQPDYAEHARLEEALNESVDRASHSMTAAFKKWMSNGRDL